MSDIDIRINAAPIRINSSGSGFRVAGEVHAATSKTTPVDADELPLVDSAASFVIKKLTWANLKATVKTYFDTLYATIAHTHTFASLTSKPTSLSGYSITGTISDFNAALTGDNFVTSASLTTTLSGYQVVNGDLTEFISSVSWTSLVMSIDRSLSVDGAIYSTSTINAVSQFNGPGTGLTGTAASLSIGGVAATATILATSRNLSISGDVTGTATAFNGSANAAIPATVTRINGVSMSGLATGILKNTTGTGAPSIAVAGTDYLTPAQIAAAYVSLSGTQTITGTKTVTAAALLINTTPTTVSSCVVTFDPGGAIFNSGSYIRLMSGSEFDVRDGTTFTYEGPTAQTTHQTALGLLPGTDIVASNGELGTPQALSGAGAVNLTTAATDYTSTGAAQALTLANGAVGQIKTITHIVDGGSGILTPTTKTGYTTITFTNAGDSVTLRYCTTAGWCVIGWFGVTIA